MEQFYAGAGREIITPPVGAFLFGYRPDVVSTSVNDDLTVTAIALASGEKKALLISATVCLIYTELADKIRRAVSAETGIPYEFVILSATHTHSGPRTDQINGWGDLDIPYCETIFLPQIVKAAKTAVNSMQPCTVGVNTIQSKVGINRRQQYPDGTIGLGQNPWGQFDPTMTVVAYKSTEGKTIASMIHYGAHCTAAGMNVEITRDWAGIMLDRLETVTGAPAAYFNGAQGDVGPRISNGGTTGNLTYVTELGNVAAVDAVAAYKSIKNYSNVSLKLSAGDVHLRYDALMPLETAEKRLAQFGDTVPTVNEAKLRYDIYKAVIAEHRSGNLPKTEFIFRQGLVAIGDIVIVPFPFEYFSEISLRLRHYSPYQYTLGFSCTNGSNSYLPSQDQLCRGGYEVTMFKQAYLYSLADDTDTAIINENLRIMGMLR